jgi:hypothetical protein
MSPRHLFPVVLFALVCALKAEEPWRWQAAAVPEPGFDLDAAQVLRVTSLASAGPGSLREAIETKGPRLIVFEVAGVIDLEMKSLRLKEPEAFVAGQTAPSPGVTLIRGGIMISGDRTVLQHLHVRPGDAGRPKQSGWEPDGITTTGGPADVWIDHCSSTWSCDENISVSTFKPPTNEPARRVVIRDCLIAEGLSHGTHHKGEHSKGTLVFGGSKEVAIVHNLYVSNTERNPVFQPGTSGVVVNNVIANPGQRAVHAHGPNEESGNVPKPLIAVVGNAVLFGEKTKPTAAIFEGAADLFIAHNEGYTWRGEPLPEMREPFPTLAKPPLWPEGLEATSTTAALWHVARFVGARPAERDPIDARIIAGALTGHARIIDSQDEVEGYPKIEPVKRAVEVPEKDRRAWLERLDRAAVFGAKPEEKPAKGI